MSAMRFNTFIFVLLVSFFCLTLAQVSYDDCCLKYVKKFSRRVQRHVVDFKLQEPDGGCNIPAIIFIMRKGRVLCANPKEDWASELMEKVEKKKERHKVRRAHPNRG